MHQEQQGYTAAKHPACPVAGEHTHKDTSSLSSEAPDNPSSAFHHDAEAVVLLFLANLAAKHHTKAADATYRLSHLLALAQSFFVLAVVADNCDSCAAPASVCTERDLYYRNPPLFGSQRSAHASIERLCRWLDVGSLLWHAGANGQWQDAGAVRQMFAKPKQIYEDVRRRLQPGANRTRYSRERIGITAVGKSTLAGALVLELCRPTDALDLSLCGTAGVALTHGLATRMTGCRAPPALPAHSQPPALIVIEKESIFQAVLHAAQDAAGALDRPLAFLCTKGYPCIAAQQWLRRVHTVWPDLQLHVLVDGDPHGLCIALTAMGLLGSQRRSSADGGAAPTPLPLRFLGVCPSRLFGAVSPVHADGRQPATSRDAISASQATPLTDEDSRVLTRLTATLQGAVVQLSASSLSAENQRDAAVARHTVDTLMREATWMARARVKCELQLACTTAENPLQFILRSLPFAI